METIQIINQRKQLENEKIKLEQKIKSMNEELNILSQECKHDIVFKYNDKQPRKIVIDGYYYCPACGKVEEFIFKNQYLSSCFKNSKIISLTDLSLVGDKDTLMKIRDEVLDNLDYYYKNNNLYDLRNTMEGKLKDYQYKKEKKSKLFIKK